MNNITERIIRKPSKLEVLVDQYNALNQTIEKAGKRKQAKRLISYDIHEKSRIERMKTLLSSYTDTKELTKSGSYILLESLRESNEVPNPFAIIEETLELINDDKRRDLIREFVLKIDGIKFSESSYAIQTYLGNDEVYSLLKKYGAILEANDDVSVHTLGNGYHTLPESDLDFQLYLFYF